MPKFIVERNFDTPLTKDQLAATEERMAPCLHVYGVSWIRSYWSADRQRMICEYEAPDAQAVRNVQREADAKFETVWLADIIE